MPISSQLLYFHLGLNADDDGIVEGYNIMKMTGCTEDDLKILVAKGFVVVLNEDLVSYITDWKEHNLIRADRKVDSLYKDLLLQVLPEAELISRKPRADCKKMIDVQWTSTGQTMDGIGKDRIGKDSIGKDNNTYVSSAELTPYNQIKDLFNSICKSLPKIKDIKGNRQKVLNSRWKENPNIEFWKQLFITVEKSDFLSGRSGAWQGCCFDWIIKPANMQKIIEGNYNNKPKAKIQNFEGRQYTADFGEQFIEKPKKNIDIELQKLLEERKKEKEEKGFD